MSITWRTLLHMCTNFEVSSYLFSCPAACHLARCCCPAGCRRSWRGRSPRAQTRCDWRQRKPSRRTLSPCAASSPDRQRRHNQLHGSASHPGESETQRRDRQFRSHIPSAAWNVCFSTEALQCLYATRVIVVHVTFESRFIHSPKIQRSRWRLD